MTNKELQFALDKALEVAKDKDMQIRMLSEELNLEKTCFKDRIKRLYHQNKILNDLVFMEDHTTAKLTISAIIGIAAGFILALILL
jgi:hypothetical protein